MTENKYNQSQYLFSINQDIIEKFQNNYPAYSRSRVIREVLANAHKNHDLYIRENRDNITVYKLNLDNSSSEMLNDLVAIYSAKSKKAINRSQVVEAILEKAAEDEGKFKKDNERVGKIFYVEEDVLDKVKELTKGKILTHEIEDFIQNHFESVKSPIDSLKMKSDELQQYRININKDILVKLDEEKKRATAEHKVKGISVQIIFREVLRQLRDYLLEHNPTEEQLENEIAARKAILAELEREG